MRFYYASLFSEVLWAVYCVIAIALAWLLLKAVRGKVTLLSGALSAVVVAILPWTQEWWIAYNFGKLCRKDAGVSVYRTVQVDGFYDSTMRSAYELTKAGRYKFVEERTENGKGIERVELASDAQRREALAWYAEHNPGKARPKHRAIFYSLGDRQVIAVLPNGVDAWKVTTLDKPTARYRYVRTHNHTPVAYKVSETEYVVVDGNTSEVIARETIYARKAHLFFVGLDAPAMLCPGPGEKASPSVGSVFNVALIPAMR